MLANQEKIEETLNKHEEKFKNIEVRLEDKFKYFEDSLGKVINENTNLSIKNAELEKRVQKISQLIDQIKRSKIEK